MAIELLGIDNAIFGVDDLDAAVLFYTRCGLGLRWRSDDKGLALFAIGPEAPGLLLRTGASPSGGGRLWVEVRDADATGAALRAEGLQTIRVETGTGTTIEVRDPSGNTIGFADYTRMPALGRVWG